MVTSKEAGADKDWTQSVLKGSDAVAGVSGQSMGGDAPSLSPGGRGVWCNCCALQVPSCEQKEEYSAWQRPSQRAEGLQKVRISQRSLCSEKR